MGEYHRFRVDIANRYGIPCALVLGHIDFMVQNAQANGEKRREGRYWMRKSVSEFADLYPYLSRSQIRRALEKLLTEGLILSGHFKSSECTKTLWYTPTKEGRKLLSDLSPATQRSVTSDTPERQNVNTDASPETLGVAPVTDRVSPATQRSVTDGISSIEVNSTISSSLVDVSSRCCLDDTDINPFGDNDNDDRPDFTTIEVYASSNLRSMTGGNIERLQRYIAELPDALIRYAIDKACGLGHPFFGYVQPILQQYVEMGFKTIAEVEAYEQKRMKKGGAKSGSNRGHSNEPPKRYGQETIV